jgi:hypothetical protein
MGLKGCCTARAGFIVAAIVVTGPLGTPVSSGALGVKELLAYRGRIIVTNSWIIGLAGNSCS